VKLHSGRTNHCTSNHSHIKPINLATTFATICSPLPASCSASNMSSTSINSLLSSSCLWGHLGQDSDTANVMPLSSGSSGSILLSSTWSVPYSSTSGVWYTIFKCFQCSIIVQQQMGPILVQQRFPPFSVTISNTDREPEGEPMG
jgi:hypothetical protein